MATQVDPRYFQFGNAFMGGMENAQEQQRRQQLTNIEQQQADQQGQYYAQRQQEYLRQVQAQDSQAQQAKADVERKTAMLEQLLPDELKPMARDYAASEHGDDIIAELTKQQLAPQVAGGSGFGNVNPGDFTPASLAKYAQTKNYADLQRAYAPQATVNLTPEGLNLAAESFKTKGQMIPGLSRSPQTAGNIVNQAALLGSNGGNSPADIMQGQQDYKANQVGLSALVKQQQMVGAFEKTAIKNLDLALERGSKVDRTGSPLINKGIIAFNQGVRGDPETASFVNALIAARTEYAKVLSGATGAQGITDSARHEAEDLFSKATSQETLGAVIATAKQEMANRMSSFDEQKAELQRSKGSGEKKLSPAEAAKLPSGAHFVGEDGVARVKH